MVAGRHLASQAGGDGVNSARLTWTNRQKVLAAGLGSALIHAVLLLGAGLAVALNPPGSPAPAPTPEPMHIEMVPSEPPPPVVPPAVQPMTNVVDNESLPEAQRRPDKALFQGERDSVAASEEGPHGDKPLPATRGRQAPLYAFNPEPPVAAPAPNDAPPTPSPQKVTQPEPPAPKPPAESRPEPLLVRNSLGELAMQEATPTPPPSEEINPFDPSFRSTAPPLPVPAKAVENRPRSLPPQAETSGSINNRGAASVDAVATPFGRYHKQVISSIRVVWNRLIESRGDLPSYGSVKIHFAVDRFGHVHAPNIVSNTANEALASISLEAINRAAVPPTPMDVVETMDSAMLQLDVTFECY